MVSLCTTRAVITITIVLGCTPLSLIENSRRAQDTQIYITEVNLELKKPVDAEDKVLGEQKTQSKARTGTSLQTVIARPTEINQTT